MSKRNLLLLSVSVMFGAALVAPSAALAQFGPPPGPPPGLAGPPPGFGAGGPPPGMGGGGPSLGVAPGAPPRDIAGAPPHFSCLGGAAGPRGLDRGGQAKFRDVAGRATALGANDYTRNGYASHGYRRGYRYRAYAAAAAYAYGGSYASSEEDCYYVSAFRRNGTYRRVLRCGGN
ncbi:hypothetical protein [Bradyrhizobium sp. AUGA SZCCT0431]|uniref:hypothetical protein n=1 Tax=Bradyrhizobium sp. AUGA SZCCT0431 TaxID=2807674 RepID=UPI001BACBFEF|nr:hypothetical protein [Bradyrhizobium sp. AUGA SZCCT0431]